MENGWESEIILRACRFTRCSAEDQYVVEIGANLGNGDAIPMTPSLRVALEVESITILESVRVLHSSPGLVHLVQST